VGNNESIIKLLVTHSLFLTKFSKFLFDLLWQENSSEIEESVCVRRGFFEPHSIDDPDPILNCYNFDIQLQVRGFIKKRMHHFFFKYGNVCLFDV
jgi:hypothetical protein